MARIRVHELAKEVALKNNELLAILKNLGVEVTNHMSSLDETQVRKVKQHLEGGASSERENVTEKRIDKPTTGRTVVIRRRAKAEKPEEEQAAQAAPEVSEAPSEEASPTQQAQAEVSTAAQAAEPETRAAEARAEEQAPPESPEQAAVAEAKAEEPAKEKPGHAVTADRARILDKPRVPIENLRAPSPAPGAAPTGDRVRLPEEDEKGRKRRGRGGEPGGPGGPGAPRRRVVTKRQFQVQALSGDEDEFMRGRRRKGDRKRREPRKTEVTVPRASKRKIRITDVITVGDLAHHMGVKSGELLKRLMELGVMSTINQGLDADTAAIVAAEYGYEIDNVAFQVEDVLGSMQTEEEHGQQIGRYPVVTVMGHVDHGKTSLLDAIRTEDVASGEAGGITQHIGAYSVHTDHGMITFIDTPGHEAFTAMRARGAQVTDIVILVVAANDGVMPQTVEAINHAKAAGVPIIIAVNKCDLPEANAEKVKQQLTEHGLVPEAWGGDAIFEEVSAKTHSGIPSLLDSVLLQAELLDLKANPEKLASGVVVESRLDKGRGPVATVLVKDGTLRQGDHIIAGTTYGRVRAMTDYKMQPIEAAGPSTPVEILGLQSVPDAGEKFHQVKDEKMAKQITEHRGLQIREQELARTSKVTLENLYQQMQDGEAIELRLVLKSDVQGSIEAIRESFMKLSTNEVKVRIIHTGVGAATGSDVMLASASNAVIICFNVRPDGNASSTAEKEGVEIKTYSIIYEAIEDVRKAMEGLLTPGEREVTLGHAEVRQTFHVSRSGTIAGCMVTDGKIVRASRVRLLRDNTITYDGRISSLRRVKDDVREVQSGFECGISLENFNDIKPGDVIEAYDIEAVARTLDQAIAASAAASASESQQSSS